jgi:hypothetical protein
LYQWLTEAKLEVPRRRTYGAAGGVKTRVFSGRLCGLLFFPSYPWRLQPAVWPLLVSVLSTAFPTYSHAAVSTNSSEVIGRRDCEWAGEHGERKYDWRRGEAAAAREEGKRG